MAMSWTEPSVGRTRARAQEKGNIRKRGALDGRPARGAAPPAILKNSRRSRSRCNVMVSVCRSRPDRVAFSCRRDAAQQRFYAPLPPSDPAVVTGKIPRHSTRRTSATTGPGAPRLPLSAGAQGRWRAGLPACGRAGWAGFLHKWARRYRLACIFGASSNPGVTSGQNGIQKRPGKAPRHSSLTTPSPRRGGRPRTGAGGCTGG
jgi:hypothetical protein